MADSKGNESEPLLYVRAENIVIDTCWFAQYQNTQLNVNSICFKNCSAFMRIVNCCFARNGNDTATIINCSSVPSAGIISGNYCLSNNYMGKYASKNKYYGQLIKIKINNRKSKYRICLIIKEEKIYGKI